MLSLTDGLIFADLSVTVCVLVQMLLVTYSYWDGSGHRRAIEVTHTDMDTDSGKESSHPERTDIT